jgi:cyanophycinase-like exopeptidase
LVASTGLVASGGSAGAEVWAGKFTQADSRKVTKRRLVINFFNAGSYIQLLSSLILSPPV